MVERSAETTSSNGDTRQKTLHSAEGQHVDGDVTGPSGRADGPSGSNGPGTGRSGVPSGRAGSNGPGTGRSGSGEWMSGVDGVRRRSVPYSEQWLALRVRGARTWPKFTSCFSNRA